MNPVTDCLKEDREYGQFLETLKKELRGNPLPLLVNGLCEGAGDAFFLSVLQDLKDLGKPLSVIFCPDEKACVRLVNLLNASGIPALHYVDRDFTFYNITSSHDYEHERLHVLNSLLNGSCRAVVTTPNAALSLTLPPSVLSENSLRIDFETKIQPREFAAMLLQAGYSRVDLVDGIGQFSLRGDILDIFPPYGIYLDEDKVSHNGRSPIRIELFGDEVDRIGLFSIESQRVHTTLRSAEIPPSREILLTRQTVERIEKAVALQERQTQLPKASEELEKEKSACRFYLDNGSGELPFADKYISLIYPESCCLLDYFSSGITPVFLRGTAGIQERIHATQEKDRQQNADLLEGGTVAAKYVGYRKDASYLVSFLKSQATVHVDSLSYGLSGKKLDGLFSFRTKHAVSYSGNLELLLEDIKSYLANGYRVYVGAESEVAAQNLQELFRDHGLRSVLAEKADTAGLPSDNNRLIHILWKNVTAGFELVTPKIAILSTAEETRMASFVIPGKGRRSKKKKASGETIFSYADLEVGDYVVHETYGIGQYTGIENLTVSGISRDYIGIQYAGSDKLFLPVEQLGKISKYTGAHTEDGTVRLSKFGGEAWKKSKAKAKSAAKDIAKDLIHLYAQRLQKRGYAFPPDDDYQREFELAFEFNETDAQLEAAQEIKADMEKPVPMDRLLCGDVGFGKTEVAMRAAYKAVLGGKQVAVLVPTTILALQHYQNFTSRMRAFAVSVDMVSRFRSHKEIEQSIRKLRRGETDIIIGTHRLLSDDVAFKDLGLIIVDEEQRFGVVQKEKLKQVAANVDVLTLTATPIPRTLNMAQGGIRDISVLDEAPFDRLPAQTYVMEHDDLVIADAIRRELHRGGQVFYLHNIVETIDGVARQLQEQIPEARITVAHGKMDRGTLEEIWEEMLAGNIDVLVCTTIIETGVDIPNANTLIVSNAHRLGLSQLHQLRGRVGRSSRRAYAYFTYPPYRSLPEEAQKRLETIRDFTEFGAGFKIALRDLEIRGAGDLLGAEQHGCMNSVGYELFIKLLNEAVLEEKGEPVRTETECTVSLDFNAYIPESYVNLSSLRMDLYRKIALIETDEDRRDITDELLDRFGNLPDSVANLLVISQIHTLAVKCDVKAVRQEGPRVVICPVAFNFEQLSLLSDSYPGRLKASLASETTLNYFPRRDENLLDALLTLFKKYYQICHPSLTPEKGADPS